MAEEFTDIGSNTFRLQHTTQSEILREVFVGHRGNSNFRPVIEIKPWKSDVDNLMFYYDDSGVPFPTVNLSDKSRLKWENLTFNPIGVDNDSIFSGVSLPTGVKFVILLDAKPTADPDGYVRFPFKLANHANFKFNLQLPLTGRPEHVEYSIAVKHKTKRNNYGSKVYTTGKIAHLFRPWCRDDLGNFTWGKWEVADADGSKITEIVKAIPKEAFSYVGATSWTVDAMIGDTDEGATTRTIENLIRGCQATSGGTAGTGDSISVFMTKTFAYQHFAKCCLYDSSTNKITNGETEEKEWNAAFALTWVTFDFSVAPTIAASTSYKMCVWGNAVLGELTTRMDSDGDGVSESLAYAAWPASFTDDEPNDDYSVYCTYTTAAAGLTLPIARRRGR